jgi:hypothetical protein
MAHPHARSLRYIILHVLPLYDIIYERVLMCIYCITMLRSALRPSDETSYIRSAVNRSPDGFIGPLTYCDRPVRERSSQPFPYEFYTTYDNNNTTALRFYHVGCKCYTMKSPPLYRLRCVQNAIASRFCIFVGPR